MGGGRTRHSRFGRYWLVGDPCGIFCAIFTWLLLTYAQFCALSIFSVYWQIQTLHTIINLVVFEGIFFLAISSHIKTMFTDPGAVPKGTLSDEMFQRQIELEQQQYGGVLYKCTKCSSIKPERAHHCSVCQRCIRRMDHHCPWVNNCVGEKNQKAFVLFTFYVALLSCHTLYWSVRHFVWCVNSDWYHCSSFGPPATTILLIFLLFEAILFSIFTAVMFGTQLSAICSDQTGIESLKAEQRRYEYDPEAGVSEQTDPDNPNRSSRWKNVQSVFGGGHSFSVHWLNPFFNPSSGGYHFIDYKPFEYSI